MSPPPRWSWRRWPWVWRRPHCKSLSFKVEDKPIIIVVAGDAKVDNSRYKAQFHTKATMLTPEQVLDFTGHAVGGVCPFGIDNPAVTTYLTCPSAGLTRSTPPQHAASAVRLSCGELDILSNSSGWIDVCKNWS